MELVDDALVAAAEDDHEVLDSNRAVTVPRPRLRSRRVRDPLPLEHGCRHDDYCRSHHFPRRTQSNDAAPPVVAFPMSLESTTYSTAETIFLTLSHSLWTCFSPTLINTQTRAAAVHSSLSLSRFVRVVIVDSLSALITQRGLSLFSNSPQTREQERETARARDRS